MTRYSQADVDRMLQAMVEEAERETAAYYQRNDVPPGTLAKARNIFVAEHQHRPPVAGMFFWLLVGSVACFWLPLALSVILRTPWPLLAGCAVAALVIGVTAWKEIATR